MAAGALGIESFVHTGSVAFHAIQGSVGSAERELSEGVFKSRDFPELLAVTVLTLRKGAIMDIILGVTGEALLTHAGKLSIVPVAFGAVQ